MQKTRQGDEVTLTPESLNNVHQEKGSLPDTFTQFTSSLLELMSGHQQDLTAGCVHRVYISCPINRGGTLEKDQYGH